MVRVQMVITLLKGHVQSQQTRQQWIKDTLTGLPYSVAEGFDVGGAPLWSSVDSWQPLLVFRQKANLVVQCQSSESLE